MKVGDLVTTKSFGGVGIVLQIDSQGHLVQIKWLDSSLAMDCSTDAYWYHPDNLEHKWFPTQPTLIKSE